MQLSMKLSIELSIGTLLMMIANYNSAGNYFQSRHSEATDKISAERALIMRLGLVERSRKAHSVFEPKV